MNGWNVRPLTLHFYNPRHSFEPFSTIVQALRIPEDAQITLVFSDRPENDFSILASNIATFEARQQQNKRLWAGSDIGCSDCCKTPAQG